jgi:DNA-binding NarL/FixJ family response regulator
MRRIMIVDDHPIVRDGLAQLISQKSGQEFEIVGMAGSVTEALPLLKTLSPDMLIVDISLGGMDGTEFIKTIRAMGHDLRILVVSMYDESLYAERVLEAGADGYVMKHEEPSEIFNAICAVAQGEVYFSNRIIAKMIRRKSSRSSENFVTAIDSLTDRELQTFRLLGLGWKTQQIADELHLSMKTV